MRHWQPVCIVATLAVNGPLQLSALRRVCKTAMYIEIDLEDRENEVFFLHL